MSFETTIKRSWEKYNNEGVITFRSETLTKRKIEYDKIDLYLLHNASRDVYDKMPKPISQPTSNTCPFCNDSNPELIRTEDEKLRVFGNRFACLPYQSILATLAHQEEISIDFLKDTLAFAKAHPEFTFLYNAKNAGKTVPHLFWLMSVQAYENLLNPAYVSVSFCKIDGLSIQKRIRPTYLLTFDFAEDIPTSSRVLLKLIAYMEHRNFNMFLFRNKVFFIPRENIEIPEGFDKHRFGGLEMIGNFVMKSKEALENANPELLLSGIEQIRFKKGNQEKLETSLLSSG